MIKSTLSENLIKQQKFQFLLDNIQAENQKNFDSALNLQRAERQAFEMTGFSETNPHGAMTWKRVTIRNFPGGDEVHIDENYQTWSEPDLNVSQREKTKRGEGDRERNIEFSARRAKTQVRRRCKVIQADCMLTLTYRECVTDEKRVQSDLKALVKRFRAMGSFEYVAVLETQKRGALHVHLACQQFPAYMRNEQGVRVKSYNLIRSMWRRIVGADNGNVDLTRPRGRNSAHRIASYIAKYVSKSISDAKFNAKSYWSSAGIVMPRPVVMVFSSEQTTWDIISLVARDFFDRGLTDIAQYHSAAGRFYWFSASKP